RSGYRITATQLNYPENSNNTSAAMASTDDVKKKAAELNLGIEQLLAREDPAVVEEWQQIQAAKKLAVLNSAKKHRDEAEAEETEARAALIIADRESVTKLQLYKDEHKESVAKLREAFDTGVATLKKLYDDREADVVRKRKELVGSLNTLAAISAASRDSIKGMARSEGYDEELWISANSASAPVTQDGLTKLMYTQIGAGASVAESGSGGMTEDQKTYAAQLRELYRLGTPPRALPPKEFFTPQVKELIPLTEEEQRKASEAFSNPSETITHKGLAIITVGKRKGMYGSIMIESIRQKLVSLLHLDMTIHNISKVNQVTVEVVVPAEHYAEMCWCLSREGRILAMDKPCYVTTSPDRSQEPTPSSTLARWKKELELAKSPAAREWYSAAIDSHGCCLRMDAQQNQHMPLMQRMLLTSGTGLAPTDPTNPINSDRFTQQQKCQTGNRSDMSTNSGEAGCHNSIFAQNQFGFLADSEFDMDTSADPQELAQSATRPQQYNNGHSPNQGPGGLSPA
ncbi:hypothetical protein GGH92_003598, partial [Coemansia sp. RSA 2673]